MAQPKTARQPEAVTWDQVAAFRLARHHLSRRGERDLVRVCADVCGVQSQIDSAGRLALWARMKTIAAGQVEDALWRTRTLVKASLMRQTLHLVPAADYPLYIAALKTSRTAAVLRVMARLGANERDAAQLNELVLKALDGCALAQPEIRAQLRPLVGKNVQEWMDRVSSVLRTALAAGLVCYGGQRGREITYVRVDQWLTKLKPVEERAAQLELFRRYLRAYGPATARDFGRWSGLPVSVVRPLSEVLRPELAEVELEGAKVFVLARDLGELSRAKLKQDIVRLLPHFDPYLLAHADKAHLVAPRFYKRVYRSQGWISPVVLVNGRVAGVWNYTRVGQRLRVQVEPFENLVRSVRQRVEEEADRLGILLGHPAQVSFAS